MKKTFLFAIMAMISGITYGQTVNGSLEDWSSTVAFSDPADLISSNNQSYLLDRSSGTVIEVAGLNGSAARLETFAFSTFGLAGTLGTDNVLLSGKESIPFNAQPDSLYVLVRHDISTGDSALISFEWRSGAGITGTVVNSVTRKLGGTVTDWTLIGIDIPDFTNASDHLSFQLTNSSGIPASLTSWLEVDEIRFTGSEQIPNNGLNDWINFDYDQPDDWISTDDLLEPLTGLNSVEMSSEATDGTLSARITGQDASITDDVGVEFSYLSNATSVDFDSGEIPGGWTVDEPSMLSFQYQYQTLNNFNGIMALQTYTSSDDLLLDTTLILPPVADWTSSSVVLPESSARVVFVASIGADEEGDVDAEDQEGEVLWLDQFELSPFTASENVAQNLGWKTWFNAANRTIELNLGENYTDIKVALMDQNGRLISDSQHINQQRISQSVVDFTPGIYIVRIETKAGLGTHQVLITE